MRWVARASSGTALALALLTSLPGCGAPAGGPARRVTIPRGASLRQATDSLASAGLVRWPRGFLAFAALTQRDRAIQPGDYQLARGMSWGALLDALRSGRGLAHRVTVPEGFALREITPLLARTLGVPVDSVRAAVRDSALRDQLGVPTPSLEGYLFPDTYSFPDGTTARAAVREMVRRFDEVWDPRWDDRLQQLAMTRHDIVTLASIVEMEARLPEERPVIAAVYLNRLRAGMPLQADPTVRYALGGRRGRLLFRDLTVDSPYNTYRQRGLPPGPIASPGKASLEAALFPADVGYLYFVADSDGHHEFRDTFQEHREARREIERARARGGRGR